MKTTKLTHTQKSFFKTIVVAVMCMTSSLDSIAQNPKLAFEVASDITGSGLGGNVCPSLAITYKKSTLSVGPNFQRPQMKLSGVQANYRYSAAKSYNGKRELFFAGNVTYHTNACMSASYIDIEESSRPEVNCNYKEMRLKVLEGYAGIGVKMNPTERFSAGFSAGMGAFNTLNKDYDKEMFRQKSSAVLQLRVFLTYSLTSSN